MGISKFVDAMQPFEAFMAPELRYVQTEIEGRFNVICPVTKRTDELWLVIELTANGEGAFIEYVSFYKWLLSLEQEPLGIEGSCNLIYENVMAICDPTLLEVRVSTGFKVINQKAKRNNWHKYHEKK